MTDDVKKMKNRICWVRLSFTTALGRVQQNRQQNVNVAAAERRPNPNNLQNMPNKYNNGKKVCSVDCVLNGQMLRDFVRKKLLPSLGRNERAIIVTGVHGKPDGLNYTTPVIKYNSRLRNDTSLEYDARTFYEYEDQIEVVNMMNKTYAEIKDIVQSHRHVVLAYCFSRNDAVLRYIFNALPVVSFDYDESPKF